MKRLGWAILIILPVWLAPQPAESASLAFTPEQQHAMRMAYTAGYHYGFPVLFEAIVWQESSFCKHMLSNKGARGCAQLEPGAVVEVTGVQIPSAQLTDPNLQDINMAIGARYLDLCLARFGYPLGISCYWEGRTRTATGYRNWGYVHAVIRKMKQLEKYDD